MTGSNEQGRYWFATVSYDKATLENWTPRDLFEKNDNVKWVYGQEEIGDGGFHHYQFIVSVGSKIRMKALKKYFPERVGPHLELCRSKAADEYVRKLDTRILGSEFEHGRLTFECFNI